MRGTAPRDAAAMGAGEYSGLEKEPDDIGDALATPNGDCCGCCCCCACGERNKKLPVRFGEEECAIDDV
jgi:hypothetical protein